MQGMNGVLDRSGEGGAGSFRFCDIDSKGPAAPGRPSNTNFRNEFVRCDVKKDLVKKVFKIVEWYRKSESALHFAWPMPVNPGHWDAGNRDTQGSRCTLQLKGGEVGVGVGIGPPYLDSRLAPAWL
jgi:hypothetical protein